MDWKRFNSLCDAMAKKLLDEGKLIEAGNAVYQKHVYPEGIGPVQSEEVRKAFFAGAEHVFRALTASMEEGDEITAADLNRMDNLDTELRKFGQDFAMRHVLNAGLKGHG